MTARTKFTDTGTSMYGVPFESFRCTTSSGPSSCSWLRSPIGNGTFAGRSGLLTWATMRASFFFISPAIHTASTSSRSVRRSAHGSDIHFTYMSAISGRFALRSSSIWSGRWSCSGTKARDSDQDLSHCRCPESNGESCAKHDALTAASPYGAALSEPSHLARRSAHWRPPRLEAERSRGGYVRRFRRPVLFLATAVFVALYWVSTKTLALPLEESASSWMACSDSP